jgi:hypothetical protein
LDELERKARELLAMKSTLERLMHCCRGDDRPECPILEGLAGAAGLSPAACVDERRASRDVRRIPG